MNKRWRVIVALVCAGTGLLAACSNAGSSPTPTTSSAPETSGTALSGTSDPDVPKVQSPLPATLLAGNPCDALTTDQIAHFVGKPEKAPKLDATFVTGPVCTWYGPLRTGGLIQVGYDVKVPHGLADLYHNDKARSARWEPTTLQSYPAVASTGKNEDQRVTGSCNVTVGIRDELTFDVALTLSNGARERGVDSCAGAKDIANTVLTNLKGRS